MERACVERFLVLVDLLHSTTLWRLQVVAQNRHGMTYRVPAISRLVRKRGGRDGNTGSFDGGVAGNCLLMADVGAAGGMAGWMGNSEYPLVRRLMQCHWHGRTLWRWRAARVLRESSRTGR